MVDKKVILLCVTGIVLVKLIYNTNLRFFLIYNISNIIYKLSNKQRGFFFLKTTETYTCQFALKPTIVNNVCHLFQCHKVALPAVQQVPP